MSDEGERQGYPRLVEDKKDKFKITVMKNDLYKSERRDKEEDEEQLKDLELNSNEGSPEDQLLAQMSH